MSKHDVIGYGELALVSPYHVQTLQNIHLSQAVNDHAKLSLTGFIPADKKDVCIQQASSTDVVTLYQMKNGQRVRPLFQGQVTELAVRSVRGVDQIELTALSATAQLDYKRQSRSFQNEHVTYEAVLREVLKNYAGADVIDQASKGAKTQAFILQYRETDWQFLQRLASHFRTVLVPAVDTQQPKLWFGLPEGKVVQLAVDHYTVSKNRTLYLQAKQNDRHYPLTEEDTICYQVSSTQPAALGDRVLFQGKELVIAQALAQMKQGIWTYDYTLLPEAGIRQAKQTLTAHTGIALTGKVLAVKKDQVRLHLSIDKVQKKEEATWFSLATPYSAEGHSGFYSPPEEGDTVQLFLPTAEESTAFVRQSIRQGGDTNPKTADADTAYWGNAKGKEVKLDPQAVTLTATEGAVYISVHQDSGIEVQSQHPLAVTAGGHLVLTGNKISWTATESIHFTCRSSSLVLDGISDIQGQVVYMTGSSKAPVPVGGA
ncbi:contractile injection system protein, VgrG/Pvc8 family [Metasolibacillus meyeri]|uniref:Contractile injection system protein, VgrG/Pvc8 family n=1 Tax=Metasolibacillus meyeri TaxID=1071052 RepID=A0AAW9NXQ8_9BACL|nr:contractile injection system protein, VgrG/Pvc8 family [Metasolibacillus meyeri]MEC1180056.1 contractile injection system protein, VgrG/Pvc8 family [Metasolibacillus meyeri]